MQLSLYALARRCPAPTSRVRLAGCGMRGTERGREGAGAAGARRRLAGVHEERVRPPILLHARYALSGTGIGYGRQCRATGF
eukprot:3940030-Rhodomonas_salina.1